MGTQWPQPSLAAAVAEAVAEATADPLSRVSVADLMLAAKWRSFPRLPVNGSVAELWR